MLTSEEIRHLQNQIECTLKSLEFIYTSDKSTKQLKKDEMLKYDIIMTCFIDSVNNLDIKNKNLKELQTQVLNLYIESVYGKVVE